MKKLLYILLALSLSVSFVACGGEEEEQGDFSENIGDTIDFNVSITITKAGEPLKDATVGLYQRIDYGFHGYVYEGNFFWLYKANPSMGVALFSPVDKGVTDKKGQVLLIAKRRYLNGDGPTYNTISFTIDTESFYLYKTVEKKLDFESNKTTDVTIALD